MHKDQVSAESYVINSMPRHLRRVLAKLRCVTLPLAIETGRFHRPPLKLDERLCLCQNPVVENEHHFLIDCELYSDLRYDLTREMAQLNPDYMNSDSITKYILLMNEPIIQRKLAKSCFMMFKRRKSLVNESA